MSGRNRAVDERGIRRGHARGSHAARSDAELALDRHRAHRLIGLEAAPKAVLGPAGLPTLRRDQNRACRSRAHAIDGRSSRAFEHFDRLDVVGIDVGCAIGRGNARQHRLASRVIADRHAIDDDRRLTRAKRLGTADLNRRRSAGVTAGLVGQNVRDLSRHRLHDVGLVGALDDRTVNGRRCGAQLLASLLRTRAGHDNFIEA